MDGGQRDETIKLPGLRLEQIIQPIHGRRQVRLRQQAKAGVRGELGHEQRRRNAFAGNVAKRDGQLFASQRHKVVVISSHLQGGLVIGVELVSGDLGQLLGQKAKLNLMCQLQVAFDAIRLGARFVATNRDPYCPVPGGGLPDCAAVIAAIEASTGARVEEVVGKPSAVMAHAVLDRLGLPPERAIMVGDRLETDIAMGVLVGMPTALVLTGATRRSDLARASVKPQFVLEDLRGLLP